MDRIAITGIGVISPLGIGREAFWQGCKAARSGIRKVTGFDTNAYRSNIAATVEDFDPGLFMPRATYRRMSRVSRMTVAAASEALEDSGLEMEGIDKERVAIVIGTSYGGSSSVDDFYESLLREGPRGAQPIFFPETVPNAPASHIAMVHGLTGPNTTFCQNEISAENAIVYGRNLILQNQADTVLAGGGEELSQTLYTCYDALRALNKVKALNQGNEISLSRRGLVLGEGAGILVMEREAHALARGARIYGKLASAAITGGAAPTGHYEKEGKQLERAIGLAMKEAGLDTDGIDQVDISANLSGELDLMEYRTLKRIFSEEKSFPMVVSPLKYLLGDSGAAGAERAAAVLLSLRHQRTLPGIGIEKMKKENHKGFDWEISTESDISTTLMTSSTFGGGHCALVFSKE